jgi:RNA polymerase primary sigma factor
MAVIAGVVSVVRMHISRGDDFDARDVAGLTPLMLAASKDRSTVCEALIDAGANLTLCDPAGRDALTIARTSGSMKAAEVLSVAMFPPEPVEELVPPSEPESAEWLEPASIVGDRESGIREVWEEEEVKPAPEGDESIANQAVAIHEAIALHVLIDTDEDWADFVGMLPEEATRPIVEGEFLDKLRGLLLRAMRTGRISEESLMRICSRDGEHDENIEKLVRALLAELDALPDDGGENPSDLAQEDPDDREEADLAALLTYADDLDPWRCDPARVYLKESKIGRLLTAEEEIALGKEMEQSLASAIQALAKWPTGLDALEKCGAPDDSYEGAAAQPDLSGAEEMTDEEEDVSQLALIGGVEDDGDATDADSEVLAYSEEVERDHLNGSTSKAADPEHLKSSPVQLLRLMKFTQGDPNASQFRKAIERYSRARETMTISNLRLVYSIVQRYQGHGLTLDDLLQEGNLGLIKAAERYDWRRGFKFSTYATWWIRQSAHRALADKGRTIRVPVHLNEKAVEVDRAARAYETENGIAPSDCELAALISIPKPKISTLRARMEEPACLHDVDESDILLADKLCCAPECLPDYCDDRNAQSMVLQRVLSGLDKRLADVIVQRYGLDGSEPQTLEEIGQTLGVTRERIRQMEVKAMTALAHPSRRIILARVHFPVRVWHQIQDLHNENRKTLAALASESHTGSDKQTVAVKKRGRPRKKKNKRAFDSRKTAH